MTKIVIEHLNYGKLAFGDNLRVPSSEGYGVTRRSKGLNKIPDANFLLARLLEIKKFDREFIDEAARKAGCLVVRAARAVPKMAIVRARFRSEDGEDGTGRLYQQTAIWAVNSEDWALYPAAILAETAKLEAKPDLLGTPAKERLEDEPLAPIVCQRVPFDGPWSSGVKKILDVLLPSSLARETGEDRRISFGKNDFSNESEFLDTVGEALSLIDPATFGRWQDICIASGLRLECGGLFIRYLPSESANETNEISDHDIRLRLDRLGPARARRVQPAIPPQQRAEVNPMVKKVHFRE